VSLPGLKTHACVGYSKQREQQGFTLVELLVGLTLLSVMALVLYSAFWLGMRSWQTATARHEDTEDMRLAADFFHAYLSKAYPLMRREDTEQRLQFEGNTHRLRFVTEMASHLGIAGLYMIVLELIEDGENRQLIATRTLFHSDLEPLQTEAGQFTQRAVLARNLSAAHFTYFGPLPASGFSQPEAPDQWQDQWTDAQRLPTLVGLEVTPNAGAPWPKLVFRLRVDGLRHDLSAKAQDRRPQWGPATQPGNFFSTPLTE
jgi:general secretion pathway protein J